MAARYLSPLNLIFTFRVIFFFFFSLKCCLTMCQLMEAEDTNALSTLNTQNGMCVPGKGLVMSAPSNSSLEQI